MPILRITAFVAGFVLVGWTLLSAIRTVVLPRSAQSVLSRGVFRGLAIVFNLVGGDSRSFAWRDRVWALYAPVGLLALAAAWVVLVLVGFMGMYWAVQPDGSRLRSE